MIDKVKFIETFWEICDERLLYLYNITNEEIDMLLAETIDRVEKHSAADEEPSAPAEDRSTAPWDALRNAEARVRELEALIVAWYQREAGDREKTLALSDEARRIRREASASAVRPREEKLVTHDNTLESRADRTEAEVERLKSGDAWKLLSQQLENALDAVDRLRVLIGIGEI